MSVDASGKACCWDPRNGRCTGQVSLGFSPSPVSLVLPGGDLALQRQPRPTAMPTDNFGELSLLDTASMTIITSLKGWQVYRLAITEAGKLQAM